MNPRRWLLLVLIAVPPLIAAIALTYALTRDGSGDIDVTLREGGQPVMVTTERDAIHRVAQRVGFEPAVPDRVPGTLQLTVVDSLSPPQADALAPRSLLTFQSPDDEGQWMGVAQSTQYWGVDLTGWERLDLDREGTEAWTDSPEGAAESQYWITHRDRMFVYVGIAGLALSRDEAVALLKEIASQLR